MTLEPTQPLTEISTRNLPWGVKGGRRVRLTTSPPSMTSCLESVGASTSHITMGLHGLLQEQLYFTFLLPWSFSYCVLWHDKEKNYYLHFKYLLNNVNFINLVPVFNVSMLSQRDRRVKSIYFPQAQMWSCPVWCKFALCGSGSRRGGSLLSIKPETVMASAFVNWSSAEMEETVLWKMSILLEIPLRKTYGEKN
jgi:hypothetical protein